ncbi:MAG: diadenylate cyclase CdaA [Eubacterium sp.]|nr:diadenylate cyclase CdaA [Eubacterium sp.]
MSSIIKFLKRYTQWISIPDIGIIDIIEIVLLAFVVYHIIIWVKDTRAWVLLKGIVVLFIVWILASVMNMSVLLWIFQNAMVLGITAIIIIFQPEFRRALEQLGRKTFSGVFASSDTRDRIKYEDRSIQEIVKATFEMAAVKTGALIVVEGNIQCREYERTGIPIEALISSQLIVNIFEHNTPLHDGAVIVRNDKIVSATCYLPLSDNVTVSKELGTRHRAGLGISEVSDSLTIIVSEETGLVSLAEGGKLTRGVDEDTLQRRLKKISGMKDDADLGKGSVVKRVSSWAKRRKSANEG